MTQFGLSQKGARNPDYEDTHGHCNQTNYPSRLHRYLGNAPQNILHATGGQNENQPLNYGDKAQRQDELFNHSD